MIFFCIAIKVFDRFICVTWQLGATTVIFPRNCSMWRCCFNHWNMKGVLNKQSSCLLRQVFPCYIYYFISTLCCSRHFANHVVIMQVTWLVLH